MDSDRPKIIYYHRSCDGVAVKIPLFDCRSVVVTLFCASDCSPLVTATRRSIVKDVVIIIASTSLHM